MSVSSSHQSVGAVSPLTRSQSKRSFLWKMEVDDPTVGIAAVGVTNCTQTEEQVDAGSNVSKNVQRM